MRNTVLFTAIILLAVSSLRAQSHEEVVRSLKGQYDKMTSVVNKETEGRKAFAAAFVAYVQNHPETMDADFSGFADGKQTFVISSEDKRLRIYSWDLQDIDFRHDYAQVIQWRDERNEVHAKFYQPKYGVTGYCYRIESLPEQGVQKYLVFEHQILGSCDHKERIRGIEIDHKKMKQEIPLFKDKAGVLSCDLAIEYSDHDPGPEQKLSFDTGKAVLQLFPREYHASESISKKAVAFTWRDGYFRDSRLVDVSF